MSVARPTSRSGSFVPSRSIKAAQPPTPCSPFALQLPSVQTIVFIDDVSATRQEIVRRREDRRARLSCAAEIVPTLEKAAASVDDMKQVAENAVNTCWEED